MKARKIRPITDYSERIHVYAHASARGTLEAAVQVWQKHGDKKNVLWEGTWTELAEILVKQPLGSKVSA